LREAALWNHETRLKIIIAINKNQELPVPEETQHLLRIARAFRNAHPKHIDRHSEFLNLKSRARVSDGMTAISADDQISTEIPFAVRSFGAHANDALLFENKIDNLVLHLKRERWKLFRFVRK